MKKTLFTTVFICLVTVAFAQENRISTNQNDTLLTPAASERVVVPITDQKTEAVQRRSTSEIEAEIRSKSKTQSNANSKPNPYEKPLSEPTPAQSSGSGTSKPVATPAQ